MQCVAALLTVNPLQISMLHVDVITFEASNAKVGNNATCCDVSYVTMILQKIWGQQLHALTKKIRREES